LIRLAIEYGLPLEINGNGIMKCQSKGTDGYPYAPFWRMAEDAGATIIAGCDAHEIVNLEKAGNLLDDYLSQNGFEIAEISVKGDKLCFRTDRER
jgi:hypothetical protein